MKLLSAHQGGRHITKAQHPSRSTAWLSAQTTSERSGRASRDAAGAALAPPHPVTMVTTIQLSRVYCGSFAAWFQSQSSKRNYTNLINFGKIFSLLQMDLHASKMEGNRPFQILEKQQKLQKKTVDIITKEDGIFFVLFCFAFSVLFCFFFRACSISQRTPREKNIILSGTIHLPF